MTAAPNGAGEHPGQFRRTLQENTPLDGEADPLLRPFDGERDHREFSGVSGEADRRIFRHFRRLQITEYLLFLPSFLS